MLQRVKAPYAKKVACHCLAFVLLKPPFYSLGLCSLKMLFFKLYSKNLSIMNPSEMPTPEDQIS